MSSSNYSNNSALQLQVIPWVRDLKLFANSEGVWGFYEGTEEREILAGLPECHTKGHEKKHSKLWQPQSGDA